MDGICLTDCTLSEKNIRDNIVNKDLQKLKIFVYDMTDSTNTRAKEYYFSKKPVTPAVFIANGQSAGRGRRGRSFDSAKGAGIYISFLVDGELLASSQTLTVRCAVKCARAIESVTGLKVGIKWVNDLFVSGRKLCGILTEGEADAEGNGLRYAIVGIGINLMKRDFPPPLCDIATTIEDETGHVPDRSKLIGAVIDAFFEDECDSCVMEEYRKRSTVIGKQVTARRIGGGEFDCLVLGISDSGELLVRRTDGTEETLISAEISILHK